jgi:hypothetical protein
MAIILPYYHGSCYCAAEVYWKRSDHDLPHCHHSLEIHELKVLNYKFFVVEEQINIMILYGS